MKYSLSGRQPLSILKNADDIILEIADINRLYEFKENIPDKTFNLIMPYSFGLTQKDINKIKSFINEGMNIRLILCNPKLLTLIKENNIPFFFADEISTYYDLNAVIAAGACAAYISDPLIFDLENIKKFNIEIRTTPNVIPSSYFNTLHKGWIRPEDVKYYENYIDVIEFGSDDDLERKFFKTYKEIGIWPDNLNNLIIGLNENIDNRLLPEDFGKYRINCKQKCESHNTCHYCDNRVAFAQRKVENGDTRL